MNTSFSCAKQTTHSIAIASPIPSSTIFLHTAHPAIYHIVILLIQRQHMATSSTSTHFITHFPCAFPLPFLLQICYPKSARAQYKSDASCDNTFHHHRIVNSIIRDFSSHGISSDLPHSATPVSTTAHGNIIHVHSFHRTLPLRLPATITSKNMLSYIRTYPVQ